jgi:hypothetical protein
VLNSGAFVAAYILAIVEVDGEQTQTVYMKKPFRIHPDFAATSVTYSIGELTKSVEMVLNTCKEKA